jgi:hypothetical protein
MHLPTRLLRTFQLVCAFGLILTVAVGAAAQGVQTGTIRGVVIDAQNLPVPGVTVTVTSPALQGQRTTVTERDGTYVLRLLPAGDYTITYELPSFTTVRAMVTVPLGGVVEQDATLRASGVAEQVTVTASTPPPIATPTVGLNITHDEVEALATSRTLQGIATLSPAVNDNSPNSNQLVINGAFAFDNNFMINGVDVNDNLFGSPQNLFIEDAIEETQVLTSGISAEYGRFSGGVVNAVTKSGGNDFSGSLRLNLTNPSWTVETPFEKDQGNERDNKTNRTWEGTFGGPILRDKIWFFGAGRRANIANSNTFNQTGIAYNEQDNNWRAEGKVTATPVSNQTFQAGFLNNHREISNTPSFTDFSIDPRTLGTQKLPNWYAFGNYRGVARTNLLLEGQVSERRFEFVGVGGTSTDILDSPIITLTQDLAHYNAPYFDATDPEQRNNRQINGSLTWFAEGKGRHEVKGGYEWYRSQDTGGNSQSATSYVFDADYATDAAGNPLTDANGRLQPVFVPGATLLENWIAVRGAKLNVTTQSFYAQDHWTINRHLSADLGVRYERARSEATGGIVGVDTDTTVPRLALAYDPTGSGRVVFHTTYGHYAGRYNEAQIGVNSNVGNPDETIGIYTGPAGQGLGFAPGFDPANYEIVFGRFPTANVLFEPGLSSPTTREFTASGGTSFANGAGYGEVSYIWRRTYNLIEDFITTSNGFTDVVRNGIDFGEFTNSVYRNTDLATRRYQSLVMQARYRLRSNWTANAAWTVQLQNEGNYEGENTNQPGAPGMIGDYPEAFDAARNFPIGRLQSAQRHRARLWTIYDLGEGRFSGLSVSALWRIESGQVYSLRATGVPLTPIQESLLAAYPDAPSSQDLYFGERGSETFPGYGALDASVNYNVPVFKSLRPWVKLDFFNVLNNRKLIGFNTTVRPDPNSPVDALGLPTGFIRGANFGKAQSTADFPVSQPGANGNGGRGFRMALGFRF